MMQRIVCCFAPEDKKLVEKLHAHLQVLEFQDVHIWYARHVLPGEEWERERDLDSSERWCDWD